MLDLYESFSVEKMAKNIGSFLTLYHESMAALVQGYREVTMDAKGKFKFEADETKGRPEETV